MVDGPRYTLSGFLVFLERLVAQLVAQWFRSSLRSLLRSGCAPASPQRVCTHSSLPRASLSASVSSRTRHRLRFPS